MLLLSLDIAFSNILSKTYKCSLILIFLKSIDKVLKITEKSVISKFLSNIQNMYRSNPYHNAMHAADVANSVGFFLINGLASIFNQLECSTLLISALAHDLGHPG